MKLDKNTVIGFSLLLILFVSFFWYNNKQAEAFRVYDQHIKDSTAKAVAARQPITDTTKANILAAQQDSINKVAKAGTLVNAAIGTEKTK